MPLVYDAKTGQPLRLSAEQASDALRAGAAVLAPGSKVNVIDRKGAVYQVPAADIGSELGAGSRLESEVEARTREVQRRQEGKEIEAFLLGLGRTMTFSGTDVVGALAGKAETISEIGEAFPEETTAGEITGAVGPMLVPGGAAKTILGKGLQAAAAPVKGVARLGTAVERGVQRMLGPSAGKGIIRQGLEGALATGAGAAVESIPYGAGQFISEAVLGEIEPSAENFIDHVSLAAVLGGGVGSALGGAMRTAGAASRQGSARARRWFAEKWSQQTGQPLIEGVKDAFASAGGVLSGRGKETIKGLMTPEAKAAVEGGGELLDRKAIELAEQGDILEEAADKVVLQAVGKQKKATFEALTKQADPVVASERTIAALDELEARLDDILKAEKGDFGFLPQTRQLKNRIGSVRKDVLEAAGEGDVGRMYGAFDDLKRDFQHMEVKATRAMGRGGLPGSDLATLEELRKLSDEVALPLLEKPEVWGPAAAGAQSRTNARWRGYLTDIKRRMDHKLTEAWEGAEYWERGKMTVHHKPAGYRSLLDDMGGVKSMDDLAHTKKQLQKQGELLDEIAATRELGQVETEALKRWHAARKRFEGLLDDGEKVVGRQNQLKMLEEATRGSGFDAGTGAVLGGMMGGPWGAMAGLLAGAVANPAKTLRQLYTLDRVIGAQRGRVRQAVGRYVDRVKGVGAAAGARAKRVVGPVSVLTADRDEKLRRYEQGLSAYSSALGDQGVDRLARSAEEIVVVPNIAAAMGRKAAAAAAYALRVAPKPSKPPAAWSRAKYQPTDDELDRWAQVDRALQRPSTVIEDLAGGYVSRSAVDAVREVYPETYLQIVEELSDRLAESEGEIPYEERVQIAVLFDLPAEPTATPEAIAAWQSGYQPTPDQQMRAAGPGRRELPVGRLTKPEMQLTQAQRLEGKA